MSLSGKNVLIVGGGTGIGRGVAQALAADGAAVVVAGRREEKLRETADGFAGSPAIRFYTVDVADRDSVSKLVDWTTQELGQIDIFVNCAGVNLPKRTMRELAPEDWDRLMTINSTGAFNCMHAILPQMRERKDGIIINISSVSGVRAGLLGGVAYNASKFAMAALGITVGQEEKDTGIRITNIYPGEVETPILEMRPTPVPPERLATMLQPEDIAAATLMVANLPPRARVAELVILPTNAAYV